MRHATMLYSSGTTGRPKGVERPLSGLMAYDVEEGDPTILLIARLSSASRRKRRSICRRRPSTTRPRWASPCRHAAHSGATVVDDGAVRTAELALRCIEAQYDMHA